MVYVLPNCEEYEQVLKKWKKFIIENFPEMSNYDLQTFELNTLGFSSGTKKSVSFNLLYNTFF